jgi:hypothetical protein
MHTMCRRRPSVFSGCRRHFLKNDPANERGASKSRFRHLLQAVQIRHGRAMGLHDA